MQTLDRRQGGISTQIFLPPQFKNYDRTLMATPFMSRYGKQKIISQSILTTAYVMLPTKKIRNIRPNVVWVLGEGPRDLIQKLY